MPWVQPTFSGVKEPIKTLKEEFDKLAKYDIEQTVKKVEDLINVLETVKIKPTSSETSDSSSNSTDGTGNST